MLAQVARRLERSVGIADVCGRLGGDEFLVLTPCCSESDLARLSNRMISSIEEIIVARV